MQPALPAAIAAATALLVTPAAHAASPPPDGAATVTLPACGQASPVTEVLLPDCSYVALGKRGGGVYYSYLSSAGDIRMAGTLAAGTLTFPASGQSWPGLSISGGVATVKITKTTVKGTVDSGGAMTMTLPYEATISAGGLSCKVKGTASMSSGATDTIGGAAGRPVNPDGGSFAVAGTSGRPTTTGALCAAADQFLDLDRGLGWYVDGTLVVDGGTPVVRAQTASVDLPKRVKRKGRTVLIPAAVVTSAGQTARATVTWGKRKSAKGASGTYATLRTKGGKVVIRTKGAAKRLFVRLTLSAPAASGYSAFRTDKVWVVR